MPTTLAVDSFSPNNLRERSKLSEGIDAGATNLKFESTQGFAANDVIYLGDLSREGCEKAVIASVVDETNVVLSVPVGLPHKRFEWVTSVLGDLIHIYRAANVDGSVPADAAFTVLATRDIDPDQLSTYYTDSAGNSGYWYASTYYNATTLKETSLDDSDKRRGDDFGHYASLTEIRAEAGFSNNYNLKDSFVDQQRRAAEAEINSSLSGAYTTPFTPVPEQIHVLTIQLAAGLLMQAEYGSNSSKGKDKLEAARQLIKDLQDKSSSLVGDDGASLASSGIGYYPDDDAPRAFEMGVRF